MVEVGTFRPPLATFGMGSPIALLVLLTGFMSNKGAPQFGDIGDGRWNQVTVKLRDMQNVREVVIRRAGDRPERPDQD